MAQPNSDRLERRLEEIEERFRVFMECSAATHFQTEKGKGKGKGRGKNTKKNTESDFNNEVALEAQRRLRSFLENSESPTPSTSAGISHNSLPQAPPSSPFHVPHVPQTRAHGPPSMSDRASVWTEDVGETKKVFIQNIEVTTN